VAIPAAEAGTGNSPQRTRFSSGLQTAAAFFLCDTTRATVMDEHYRLRLQLIIKV
jgi:hypothetical protein